MWLGTPMPKFFEGYIKTCKKLHPDWEYRFWTEKDLDKLSYNKEVVQNLIYKGTTFQEYLNDNKLTEKEHEEKELLPEALKRLNAGIILSKIAESEKLSVTPEELEMRILVLKNQYSDDIMRKNLETEEGRRSVASRLLTEKTLSKIKSFIE
jgi:FKBP-type peptidyl-prolyl cis-trans isomerase (trigger factor)